MTLSLTGVTMLFEVIGFLISTLIGSIVLIYRLTGDIGPNCIKRLLYGIALKNWKICQPKRMNNYNSTNPTTTRDIGILPCAEENLLEEPLQLKSQNETDEFTFYGIDDNGNSFVGKILKFYGGITEITLHLSLHGVSYSVYRKGQSSSSKEFILGNFKFEIVESMRCWRIWYNGILENDNNGTSVHAVINFLWKPFDSPMDSRRDININLLTNFWTNYGNFGSNLFDFASVLTDGYTQFGAHHGTIRIDEGQEEGLYLYGFRLRKWDLISLGIQGKFGFPKQELELFGMSGSDGKAFRLVGTNGGWIDGSRLFPSNKNFHITQVDLEPEAFLQKSLPKLFTFSDEHRSVLIEIWPSFQTRTLRDMEVVSLKLTINGRSGRGILLRKLGNLLTSSRFSTIIDTTVISPTHVMEKAESAFFDNKPQQGGPGKLEKAWKVESEIVSFNSTVEKDISVMGGKGASLAQLYQLSGDSKEFKTAKGFCVTTALFKRNLPLDEFRIMFSNSKTSELDQTCLEVMKRIKLSNARSHIVSMIGSWIDDTFGEIEVKLAVRSSGVLEDGSELSCAGQNETFLGVLPQDVAGKVVDCWASLFTPQSVRYRLNHGQPAVSEMAVVVQEMVHASAAGVLFTADPRTGNPFKLMISGNYGLGESVVSAKCDPDTISLLRTSENSRSVMKLEIGEKRLGKKKSKIILNEDGLTSEVDMTDEESRSFCINDKVAIDLGEIAIRIEQELGELKPVDIEWALHENGSIYILQCRNITSLDSWTDFELIHEADSAYVTTFERLTHANTGEVMPGVTSPLSLSVVLKLLDIGIQHQTNLRSGISTPIVPYTNQKCIVSRQRILLNILNVMFSSLDKEINTSQVASDLSIFGHRVLDESLHALAVERHGITPPWKKLKELKNLIMTVWRSQAEMEKVTKIYSNYSIPLDKIKEDTKTVYQTITDRIFDLYDVCRSHCMMSVVSTVTQMFALLTLAQGRKADDWDSDIYEDVSKVLSVCMDVESADLPTTMDELAKIIGEHGGSSTEILTNFVEKSPMEGFDWISTHEQKIIPESLKDFFEKHGHRCISELDLMRKSWRSDPIPFVTLLQSLVRNKVKYQNSKTNGPKSNFPNDEALLNSLHTRLSFTAKRFLKFMLPFCRRGVWSREKTKSYLVRTGDQLKQAYERLAYLMVKDHLLPDSKLLYFMSHQQIGQLLERHPSSPKILYKAMRKMKLLPELNKEKYPEITIGIREPVDEDTKVEFGDSITATPVSSGKVQAKVKVCMSIEEASKIIEPGDILITHGTDIGWSPFFPILGGIVTELGGLISHGAVVAREYGLPCIVGAGNATKIFKSGENAILDAGKGTLTKVKVSTETNHRDVGEILLT